MSGLPIKKIYIDSKHKVSGSNSDFKCQLKGSYLMPENAVFKICDVCILYYDFHHRLYFALDPLPPGLVYFP